MNRLRKLKIGASLLVKGTGEMSKKDLEPGGEFYESRQHLEKLCKDAGLKCEVRPFDVYQGPYAKLPNGAKVWIGDTEDEFYYDKNGNGAKFHSGKDLKKLYSKDA